MEVHVNQLEKRSWIEIDLSQIRANLAVYRKALKKDAEIMAVIKADAYGHGDVQVARILRESGVRLFAVSNIDEAVGLRNAGIEGEILILGYSSPIYARILQEYDLTQSILSEEYASELAASGLKIKCQFAIDTGMNRIGIDADNCKMCSETIHYYAKVLDINGIFTHLCVADTDDKESEAFTCGQISKFKAVSDAVSDLNLPFVHCCNSAGGLFYLEDNDRFSGIGDIIRLGINLYGLNTDECREIPEGIKPAMCWKSVISMVKDVHPGESVGYGRTFTVTRESRIATVTTGYADGLNRLLSNKGFLMVNGMKAPIVGRICMDQTMIDVTDIPNVRMGTKVTIIGKNGSLEYTADDMAKDLDTIGYEIICNITKRVQRFYVYSNVNL